MAHIAIKIATGVILAGQVVFWIIGMAGIAAANAECVKSDWTTNDDCNSTFDFPWWILFFQLFLIICMVAYSIAGTTLERFSLALAAMLAINTTLLMVTADTYNNIIYSFKDTTGSVAKRYVSDARAAMAGTVVMCMLNLIYLVMLADKEGALMPVFRDGSNVRASTTTTTRPTTPAPYPAAPVQSTPSMSYDYPSKAMDMEMGPGAIPVHAGTPQYAHQQYASPANPQYPNHNIPVVSPNGVPVQHQ